MAETAEELEALVNKDGGSSITHAAGSSHWEKSFNFGPGNPLAPSAQAALEKNKNIN
jgi:hypothetical protein